MVNKSERRFNELKKQKIDFKMETAKKQRNARRENRVDHRESEHEEESKMIDVVLVSTEENHTENLDWRNRDQNG